ncbi:eotaxin-like [Huso huso]|uniref:Eotaxin-like n=1 Tax=Huso huso TaxID=61971 RepID=A0ABR0ZHP5_HUSHU
MKQSILVFLCLAALAACTFATVGSIAKCDCLRLTDTVLRPRRIQGFHEQKKDGRCPVDAVVFTTIKGKKVCSDPTKIWVKEAIKKLGKPGGEKKKGKARKQNRKKNICMRQK